MAILIYPLFDGLTYNIHFAYRLFHSLPHFLKNTTQLTKYPYILSYVEPLNKLFGVLPKKTACLLIETLLYRNKILYQTACQIFYGL